MVAGFLRRTSHARHLDGIGVRLASPIGSLAVGQTMVVVGKNDIEENHNFIYNILFLGSFPKATGTTSKSISRSRFLSHMAYLSRAEFDDWFIQRGLSREVYPVR